LIAHWTWTWRNGRGGREEDDEGGREKRVTYRQRTFPPYFF